MANEVLTDRINFLDLKDQYSQIKDEAQLAIQNVIDQTAFSGGSFSEEFEENFAAYCHAKYAVGVNSGTSALHLAMIAAGIGEGDEVILPANTFIATAWGVSYVNATPVFVDCDPETWNIDSAQIEKMITSNTKAIIGVHLYGQPFDIDAVKTVAEKNNLLLIEDSAQAHGAEYKEQKVGSLCEMGCFSFYPGKNLGAYGEGGAVTTNTEKYYKHIKKLQSHGSNKKYYHDEIGYNMRMDGIQGAVLNVKLKYIDAWNRRRVEIAGMYWEGIKNPAIKLQRQPDWAASVYHLFVITCDDRGHLLTYLNEHNVYPGQHYPVPCHLQKAYEYLGHKEGDFPNSEYLSAHCLSLPIYAELSNEKVQRVIDLLNDYQHA